MEQIYKYPRTRHLEGSREQAGDEDLTCVAFSNLCGAYLVLEEKVDGANCGISFDSDGTLYLQSRGHFLNGGYGERQFDLFKLWASCFEEQLRGLLTDRYIMYGEWLYAKHTVFYDQLPHYFMEFDIFDKKQQKFFSTKKRREFLQQAPFITSVRVLDQGCYQSVEEIARWIGPSQFISRNAEQTFLAQCNKNRVNAELAQRQTDLSGIMEGIYIKVEDGDYVIDRLKYVRGSFLNTILDSESHWASRPIVPNRLAEGVDLFSPTAGEPDQEIPFSPTAGEPDQGIPFSPTAGEPDQEIPFSPTASQPDQEIPSSLTAGQPNKRSKFHNKNKKESGAEAK